MLFAGKVKQDWQFKRRITPRRRFHKTPKDINKLRHIKVVSDLRALLEHRGYDRIVETYLREQHLIKRGDPTSIGEDVELTFQERFDLGITTIRPFDITWRECRRRYKDGRNARKRNRAAVKRREAGMRPWIDSLSRTKPWEAEGISRSTWYKRRKTASDKSVPPPSLDAGLETDCPSGEKEGFAVGASPTTEPIAFHFFPDHEEGLSMRPLHDYQQEAIDNLRETVKQGCRRIMVQAPTGAGKTRLAAEIVDSSLRKGNRVAFCVPAIPLVDQTVEAFYAEGIRDIGVIQANHHMTDWSRPVQVASIQTIQARKAFPEAKTVIFDEAHRLFQAHKEWLQHPDWQNVPMIGLSATPWARGLGKFFSTLLKVTDTKTLIDRKFLSPFRVFSTGHPDLSGVRTVAGDYVENELSNAMQAGNLTADIVKTYQERWGKGRTLCFAVDKAHAKHLQERFEKAGIPAGYQDADTTADERREIRNKFHSGEYQVVVNIQTLTTGVDWKVDCLILARPTKSEMLFVQIIGRALRTDPDNPDKVALILDHSDTTSRLGFVTDIDHDELDDGKPREKDAKPHEERKDPLPKECEGCAYLMPPRSPSCPNCGRSRRPECTVFEAEGELQEIVPGKLTKVGTKKEWSYAEKKVFLAELKGYALDKGYKPGWAAMKFKDKFGDWPERPMDKVEPATLISPGTLNFIRYRNIKWAKSKHNPGAQA